MPVGTPKHSPKVQQRRGSRSATTPNATPPEGPHVAKAIRYARAIISGEIPACEWVVKACKRFTRDLERAEGDWPYRLDVEKAERACRFIELLPHVKGKWAAKRELMVLQDWQCFIVVNIFGWLRKLDGFRRFRQFYGEIPRKNGKSPLAAAIGLYMLSADGEMGAEVYAGATTEKQAWEVFRPARLMALKTPALLQKFGIQVNASNIHILGSGGRFEPMIGKPGDGASPSCSITDEYHEHQTSEQFDTMITGMGAREQPLAFVITTAGDNIAGPCYDLRDTLKSVLNDVLQNEELFGLIYTIDEGDEWSDPAILRKANPNYDISVGGDFLLARQAEAKASTRARARFLTKHLGLWLNSSAGYFDLAAWQACEDKTLRLEDFFDKGCRAYLGLDLASKVDIAALEILIELGPESYVTFGKHYLPEDTIEKPENEHYRDFLAKDCLIQTDGNITDYERIEEDILELADHLTIVDIAYDPHQATMLVTRLQNQNLPLTEFRPLVLNFSEPMKQLDAWIKSKKLKHPVDPCMTWMMSNVTAQVDRKDNVYPRKERDDKKIDGPVALISTIGRAISGDVGASVYEDRGLLFV